MGCASLHPPPRSAPCDHSIAAFTQALFPVSFKCSQPAFLLGIKFPLPIVQYTLETQIKLRLPRYFEQETLNCPAIKSFTVFEKMSFSTDVRCQRNLFNRLMSNELILLYPQVFKDFFIKFKHCFFKFKEFSRRKSF